MNFSFLKKNFFNERNIWILSSNFLKLFFLVILSRILTSTLSFDDISRYYLVLSTYSFFSIILISPFGEFINKNVIRIHNNYILSEYLESFYFKILSIISIGSFFVTGILSLYKFGFNGLLFFIIPIIISLLLFFKSILDANLSILNATGKFKNYALLNLSVTPIQLFIISVLIFSEISNFIFWLLAFSLANILISINSIFLIRKVSIKENSSIQFKLNNRVKKFVKSILLGNFLIWLLNDGIKFLIENKFGLYEGGILIIGFGVSTQIFSISTNFIGPLFSPELFKSFSLNTKHNRGEGLIKYSKKMLSTLTITLIGAVLMSELIMNLLIDKSKIVDGLLQVIIIGFIIEFIKAIINVLKQFSISENKLETFSLLTFIPVLIISSSLFIDKIDNILILSKFILFAFIIYLIMIIIQVFNLFKISTNQ